MIDIGNPLNECLCEISFRYLFSEYFSVRLVLDRSRFLVCGFVRRAGLLRWVL